MAGGNTPKIIQLIRQAQGLDPEEESILKKLTPHVPGVVTFADHNRRLPWTTEYRSVLVFADISGFTALCQRYAALENSGIDQLSKNLNDYLGAMVDLILKADGDVLKFAGDAILSLWRVNSPQDLLCMVEKVIRCCLNIQKFCGEWKTDIGIVLTVKLGVSIGNTSVTFLGNDTFRVYVEQGKPVTDVNTAEHFCKSGYIVLSPYTWEICRKPLFTFEVLEDGQHIRILSMKDKIQPVGPAIEVTDAEDDQSSTVDHTPDYITSFKTRDMSFETSASVKLMANRMTGTNNKWNRPSSSVSPAPPDMTKVEDTEPSSGKPVQTTGLSTVALLRPSTSPIRHPSHDSPSDPHGVSTSALATPPATVDPSALPGQPRIPAAKDRLAPLTPNSGPSSPNSSPPATKKNLSMARLAKLRNVAKQVAQLKLDQSLRLYVLSPVLKKLDDNQPLEYLSEMRTVSIVFMNLVLDKEFDATTLLQQVFDTVYLQSSIMHGCLNKVFLFDKGCTFLVIFGLPGYKHERDCAHALMCSFKMKKTLVKMPGVQNVAIGVTTGTTFCGVVGHIYRHEYSVIGVKVNMAARLMMHYPDKVTCDDNTFQLSRLQAHSFHVLATKRMKGLRNIGLIREYIERNAESSVNLNSVVRFQYPLLGREYEKKMFSKELDELMEADDLGSYKQCQHLVLVGAAGIGKTRLLDHLIVKAEIHGTRVISCALKLDNLFDANFLTQYVIHNLLTSAGFSHLVNKEPLLLERLHRAGYVTALHKLNFILSANFQRPRAVEENKATVEEILCCIASVCIEKLGGAVIGLDDAHHIDPKSWAFLVQLISVPGVIMVSTVRPLAVEAPPCRTAAEFFEHKRVQLRDIAGLESIYMTALACQLMEVARIPKELERMLREMTHGVPSWCEQLLVDMVEKKQLTILQDSGHFRHAESMVAPHQHYIRRLDTDDDTSKLDIRQCNQIFCSSSISSERSESGHDMLTDLGYMLEEKQAKRVEDEDEKRSRTERIAIFSPGVNPSDIRVPDSMKELIMTRIDSMRASEQLIVKCAAVLGASFSRDMIETILPKVQRVKARKCFKQLAFNGIFECANIPAARYNQMMQGRDDSISWDTCYCIKEENLYVRDLCNKMRFRNALIQQTAYETLMESQRLELHAKAAQYLETQADKYRSKIPYYVLGRIPPRSDAETEDSGVTVWRADWKRRSSSRVEDINTIYTRTRGRRFGFSLEINLTDELVQLLREQFCLDQTMGEMLQCLLPTYKMILYHWKAAKCNQNLVDQLLEATAAAVAVGKPEQATDLLGEVDMVLRNMEKSDDVDAESLAILKSHAQRLQAQTFRLQGDEDQCYTSLRKAAKLMRLKRPTGTMAATLLLNALQFKMFFVRTQDRRMRPASKASIERCCCLLDLYHYHKDKENNQLMILNAMLNLSKMINKVPLLYQVVEGYCAVMEYYNTQHNKKMETRLALELIKRCAKRHKEMTSGDCIHLSRVYSNLCVLSLETGNIPQALTMGFSGLDLATQTEDHQILNVTGRSLGLALMLAYKINQCIDLLVRLRRGLLDRTTDCWYYAICLELGHNGDSGPEDFVSCHSSASTMMKNADAVLGELPCRYFLAMSMAMYFCRRQRWEECQRWYDYWEVYKTTELSFLCLYALCREVEIKLLSISRHNKPQNKPLETSLQQDFKVLKNSLSVIPGLKPRVYHLQAYHCALQHNTLSAKKHLRRARKAAHAQGNELEWRWVEHHNKAWFSGPSENRRWPTLSQEDYTWHWKPQRGNFFTWPTEH